MVLEWQKAPKYVVRHFFAVRQKVIMNGNNRSDIFFIFVDIYTMHHEYAVVFFRADANNYKLHKQ